MSAISGTSTIAERPRSSAAGHRAQVHLRLAAAGDAVEQQRAPRIAGVHSRLDRRQRRALVRGRLGGACPRRAPTCSSTGRRDGSARLVERHEAAALQRAQRAVPAAHLARERRHRQRPARQRAGGRPPGARRGRAPPSSAAARPASVSPACSELRGRSGRPEPVPVPGGSTRASPRAGAEQYSRASQRPRRTSAGGHVGLQSARSGSASRSGGRSLSSARSTTTPEEAPRPEGHHEHAAHRHARHVAPQPVVERAAERAGRGQRLDLGDHASNLRGGPDTGRPARRSCGIGRVAEDFEALGLLDDVPGRARARGAPDAAAGAARGRACPDEELRRAVALNQLVLLPVELALSEGSERFTLEEVAERSGLELAFLDRLNRALGGPRPEPGARVFDESDVRQAANVRQIREAGLPGRRDPRDRPRAGHGSGQPRGHGGHRLRLRLPPRRRHRVRPVGPLRAGDARAAAPARAGPGPGAAPAPPLGDATGGGGRERARQRPPAGVRGADGGVRGPHRLHPPRRERGRLGARRARGELRGAGRRPGACRRCGWSRPSATP